MTEKTPNTPDQTNKIRSGPEIVADFIQAMKADSNLDKPTIEAIEALYRDGKLTWIDRKSTRLNSSHPSRSRMPSSA